MPPGLGQLLCALGRHLVGRCLGEERLTASRLGDKALLRLARIPCMQGDLDLAHTDRRAQRFGHCPAEVESTSLWVPPRGSHAGGRSEEHTSELQSLMRISYAVFCLKKKKHNINRHE